MPDHELTDAGDPVCWLDQVCPDCGRMIERTRHVCEPVPAG
ncbi:hypothetical protein [Diaminobutyricimonas sp. LJ205]|nr:hypothetical protein [Diaminobutyricimonas sp. LJ205]